MKKVYFLFILTLCVVQGNANQIDFQYYKDKYPLSESVTLNLDVVVELFINETTSELNAQVTYEKTLLALKNNPSEMGIVQIPFSAYEKVDVLSAKYYLLDSLGMPRMKERIKIKYIEEKDYYINGIFYNDLKVKQFAHKSEIVEKNVLKYSYRETYTDVKFLTRIFAQAYIQNAVDSFNLTIRAGGNVDYDLIPFNIQHSQFKYSSEVLEEEELRHYQLTEIPTRMDEEFMAPPNYVLPHFLFHIKNYQNEGNSIAVLNSVDDLYSWYRSLVVSLHPDTDYIKELAKKIVGSETDEEQKIKLIYQWMQENIQYVAFEDGIAGFKPEEAKIVCDKLFGDCKGMANLLVELLNSQGFDAHHTWIGTRSLPYDYSIPSLAVDNHMICALKWKGETYFLDATDKSTQWYTPSSHIQGKMALVGFGDDFQLLKVPVTESNKNKVTIQAVIFVNDSPFSIVKGTLELNGLVRNRYSNYIKYASVNSKNRVIQGVVRHYLDDFIVDEKDVSVNDDGVMMTINFKGRLAGIHTLTETEMNVYPNLGFELREFLKQDSVDYPIFVNNRFDINYNVTYISDAYIKPSQFPSSVGLSFNNGVSKFTSNYSMSGQKVKYTSSLVLNKELIQIDELAGWNEYLLKLRSSVYQPLTLRK